LDGSREASLDQHPACGEVIVAKRQRPYRMHVFWQHDPGKNFKGMPLFNDPHRLPKLVDMFDEQ